MTMDNVQFSLIAESGILEAQALLFCESVRRFAGRHSSASIIVISPRVDRRPSEETVSRLRDLDVSYVEYDITSVAPSYGTTYRIHCAANLERQSTADTMVFVDSDIVVTSEPDLNLLDCDSSARPVDVKGMCTTGPDDYFDKYWRDLCRVCGVDYEVIPLIETTVDRVRVRASYNGGFIVTRRTAGIFQATEEYFVRSVEASLRPHIGRNISIQAGHGVVVGLGAEYWGSSQACLSLAIWGRRLSARLLTPEHNFPMHIDRYVHQFRKENPLIAVHYHHRFQGDQSANPLLTGALNVSDECRRWLASRLPLES